MPNLSPTAALFPGQGSQYPGMIKVLRDEFPFTKEIFEEASDALREDIVKLCLEGSSETLQLTQNAQPTILTTSTAWYRVLEKTLDFRPAAGAGHSLGEYSALVAAQALKLSDAVRLVRKRGEMMQKAVPQGMGKMAAVIGLEDAVIKDICTSASQNGKLVVPANFNAPSQVVIAGHAEAVDRFVTLASGAEKPEWKARKVIPLNVSAPFHCPLMQQMAENFSKELAPVEFKDCVFPIVSNLDAQMRNSGDMRPLLRDQIDHPVLWTSCVQTLEKHGIKTFVEMGPSRVLAGLVKRIADGATIFSIDTMDDFKNFEKTIKA